MPCFFLVLGELFGWCGAIAVDPNQIWAKIYDAMHSVHDGGAVLLHVKEVELALLLHPPLWASARTPLSSLTMAPSITLLEKNTPPSPSISMQVVSKSVKLDPRTMKSS
jgi:hypothetical protein